MTTVISDAYGEDAEHLRAAIAKLEMERDRARHSRNSLVQRIRDGLTERGIDLVPGEDIVDQMMFELDTLYKRLSENEANYRDACNTIAAMHRAAVGGEQRGPIRGIVEDVADLRLERDGLIAQLGYLQLASEFDEAEKRARERPEG